MTRYGRMTRLFAAAGMVALVAACDENRRGVDAPPPASLAELEGVSELPYAEPARVQSYAPDQAYPYAERAYGLQRAFYDAPPDYGFYYDDVSPYVWETSDDWALYAEPWESDYRYYYYEPGAAYPYFVRDRDYGYAFSAAGILIAMFYSDGRYVPVDVVYRYAPLAGRYYARGQDLRRVGLRTEHFRVDDRTWVTEAPRITRSADPWLRAARDDRRWREWRERDGDRELQRFTVETRRRQEAAETWRKQTARNRVATIERGQDQLEAQALRARREAVPDERRDDRREAVQDARIRAEAGRRQQAAEARQVQAEQRVQAERRRDVAVQAQQRQAAQRDLAQRAQREERRQAQVVEQRGRQERAELQRRAEAASMRERQQQAQQQQAQGEARRVEQAQRRQVEVQHRQQGEARQAEQAQRQQAAAQQQRQAQAERQVRREQPQQARAPAAAERGRPAATREDGGKDRGKDDRRKD